MGSIFSKKEIKAIVVGLDNSGKTTMINKLNPDKVNANEATTATVGFQIE
jgi:GTPase SAR1 family protein